MEFMKMDLKTARLQHGITQADLSRLTGLSEIALSRLEQGHSLPRPSTRQKIAKILGPVDWLDEGSPLTAYEQRRIFRAIEIAAEKVGYKDALLLFASLKTDQQRVLIRTILDQHADDILPPTGVIDLDREDE
jgi:transcriptional regulator with XRE-family HTH domain